MQLMQAEMASYSVVYFSFILPWPSSFDPYQKAAWLSGQRVRLTIRHPLVRVLLWPLAGFVLSRPYYKSSATLINSQLGASCQLEFPILLCYILNYLFLSI